MNLKTRLQKKADQLGFAAIGFTTPSPSRHGEFFRKWLADGCHAGMDWMARHADVRLDSSRLVDGTVTIISCAYPYTSVPPQLADGTPLARYIEPDKDDYHTRMKRALTALAEVIKEAHPEAFARVFVDTPPLFEREIAARAGLGSIGRNNCLIVPGYGSYVYLGEIVTDIAFEPDKAVDKDICGTCTRCIDNCPTGALGTDHNLNANLCLSYLTIEHKGDIPAAQASKLKSLAGCDACQEVCPHQDLKAADKPRAPLPSLQELAAMSFEEFKARFGRTALGRPGIEKIRRNAQAIIKKQ